MPATESFEAALQSGQLPAIRKFPKSDLHNHSILGTRIERIESWIGTSLPRPSSLMHSLDEMIRYSHDVLYPHIETKPGFKFTAASAIDEAIEDGVTVLEMSMDVRFSGLFTEGLDEFFGFVSELGTRYKDRIDFRPEIGMSKDRAAEDQLRLAHAFIDSGLFRSIDLYGNELAQPPEPFCKVFQYARSKGLKLKAHAGEFGGPDVVARVLDALEVDEIQHGVRAAESIEVMSRLQRDRIRLNVCPSSNLALGVVTNISQHPIRALFDHGVRVTVNTDDLTIFGQSVSEEYLLLFNSHLFSAYELDAIRIEGLRS